MKELMEKIFYNHFYSEYLQVIKDVENYNQYHIDISFYKNLEIKYKSLIKENSQKFLIFDYQNKYSHVELKKNSNVNINNYIDEFDLSDPQYSSLLSTIDNKITDFSNYIITIVRSFVDDYQYLNRLIDDSKLSDIEINFGDSHNSGQTVAKLQTNNGNKLLYKPKDLNADNFYFSIYEWISTCLNISSEVPLTIAFNNYGWQEFIEYKNLPSKISSKDYYYRLGIQSFLLYTLNANDMHYENLISKGDHPTFIDLETILQPPIDTNQIEGSNNNLILNSVIQTLLFDFSVSKETNHMFMGGVTNQTKKKYYEEKIINKGNDAITLVNAYKVNSESTNLPMDINGKTYEIYDFVDDYISGFEHAYKFVITKKSIPEKYYNWKNFKIRSVLRPTYVYMRYIEYFKQMEGDEGVLKILSETNTSFKYHDKIAQYELADLKQLDVPFFVSDIYSKTLTRVNSDFHISNFFNHSAIEQFKEKVSSLNNKDLNIQLLLLKNAISAYRENVDNTEQIQVKYRDGNLDIHKEILEIYHLLKNNHSLLNIEEDNKGNTILCPISYDLYYGLSGIAILLLEYNKNYDKNLFQYLSNDLNKMIYSLYSSDESSNFSSYHGKFSYFKYLYIINKHYNMNVDFKDDLEDLLDEYLYFINYSEYVPLDYLGGTSGILSLLVDIYKDYNYSYIKKSIVRLTELILSKAIKKDSYIYWDNVKNFKVGLAHGLSGICLSLIKAYEVEKNDWILKIVRKALAYENTLICEKNNDLPVIWCNGSSGLLISRKYIKDTNLNLSNILMINELSENLIENWLLKDNFQSVCHGSHGNVLVLKSLGVDIDMKLLDEFTAKHEWTSGFKYPNENYGFFLGKSGQLFNLVVRQNKTLIKDILL